MSLRAGFYAMAPAAESVSTGDDPIRSAMSSSGQYARSADATASPVGERVVLYHRVSRTAIVLNPTGGWMWQRLSEPRTAADLTAALRQRFPALAVEDAERDVTSFLADLTKHAMVSVG